LLQNGVNVFYLTWIVSLPYLLKLEMLLSGYGKKLKNLSHLNCVLQIRHIWVQLITACGIYCKRWCTEQASVI